MILHHHYDKEKHEVQFRWSVWPTYAYETMPYEQWSEFLGRVLRAYTLREEGSTLKGLKVHQRFVSLSRITALGVLAEAFHKASPEAIAAWYTNND
tara:strand:- start:240 stop:527 length:288 start_codon:yes stop_codon:yes gene_type:complete